MEKQNGVLGISGRGWVVIGILALAASAMVLCALVVVAFGLDVGGLLGQ